MTGMTKAEAGQVLEIIDGLWPAHDWTDLIRREFGRKMLGLPITVEQVRACLVEFKFRYRGRSPVPADLWVQLRSLVPRPATSARPMHEPDRPSGYVLELSLRERDDPEAFWRWAKARFGREACRWLEEQFAEIRREVPA